jgi:energy-coupling factor transporter ATP-binding protein EcfA2/energy-coupling factor transporter transmembrane protein EcfT
MPVTVTGVSLGQILHDLSFTLDDGTLTLLVGQTGAGKSSLLDVLTGLNRFDAGEVRYGDLPLWDGKHVHRDVLKEIGVVFQFPEHQLFARTVKGEFDYSLKPLRLKKEDVAARTHAALLEAGLPLAVTGQSPLVLSGGQKRRVALASTFAAEPKWLFLDEPTAGLDPQAVERLVQFLQGWKKRTSGGIVIATHDLDAFFPIADRVLLLDRGRLSAFATPQELCEKPHLLRQARVGLPSSTALSLAFAKQGMRVPAHPLSPDEMAEAILKQIQPNRTQSAAAGLEAGNVRFESAAAFDRKEARLKNSGESTRNAPSRVNESCVDRSGELASERQETLEAAADTESAARREKSLAAAIRALDPRAKWAFYLLISLGVLLQTTWSGMALATLVTFLCMWAAQIWKREVWRLVKPFLFFIGVSIVLSGLRLGDGVSFETAEAVQTFRQLYRFLLLMVLGVWLSATTSQLKMKQGLEITLAPLKKLKLPVEAFALATSLMLRFVPVILGELRRFSRITKARGKSVKGSFGLRDTGAIIVPLLLSVLRLGEDLSLAMEARGYAKIGIKRTSSIKLRMMRHDWLIVFIGVLVFTLLAFTRWL